MKELQYAGEYDLQTCEIISSAGLVAEISANIVEINIYIICILYLLNKSP